MDLFQSRERLLLAKVTKSFSEIFLSSFLIATNNDFTEDYAGKTALDLRDELTAMQKSLAEMEEQRDTFRGEMIKYKQILVKKDKEIEDLIMGGHVSSRDRARINSGNKADILLVRSITLKMNEFLVIIIIVL